MSTLHLTHITVAADQKELVHDATLSFASGEVVVLMGPNGSGKSTLVNVVMGHPYYKLTHGSVHVDDKDITGLPVDAKAKQGLFLSLQHVPRIGGVTLATFLHKVHVARTGEAVDVLEYFLTLRELAKHYGIDEGLLNKPLTAGLSGGEKKLAEALQLAVLAPRFAILDEMDSGVDVDALHTVFRVVGTLAKKGTGFLIISHHPSLLDHLLPTHVHVMSVGKVVRSGGPELAAAILKDGFCKVIDCPFEPSCHTKDR